MALGLSSVKGGDVGIGIWKWGFVEEVWFHCRDRDRANEVY